MIAANPIFRPQTIMPSLGLASPTRLSPVSSPTFSGSLQGMQMLPNLGSSAGNLSGINSGFLGIENRSAAPNQNSYSSMLQMLEQMIAMFSLLMSAGPNTGAAQLPTSQIGSAGSYNGNSGGTIIPSGGGPTSATSSQPSEGRTITPNNAPASTSNSNAASPVNIGPGTRVLEIGDSHSVGTFGKELDAKLRGTGAQVSTYASAGATASTFVQGKSTKYGYWEKGANGQEKSVGYGKSAQTPQLESLIGREKPQVILVNLGANFRGSNPKSQVDQIGRIAKKHGIPIVWVGPPKTAKDNSSSGSLQKFDQDMAAAVAPYGTYVSSSKHTPRYSGGDGLHYSGAQGTQTAKNWASGVFNEIVGK